MEVVQLGMAHEAALADFLADFDAAGEEDIPAYFPGRDWPHARVVESLAAWSRGEQLAPGWVSCTTSFLVEGGAILGVSNFRHALNEGLRTFGGHVGYSVRPSARGRGCGTRLLAEVKERARCRGLARLLVTCDPDNYGSIKVIERNGGVLEREHFHEGQGQLVRAHWIEP